MDLILFNQCFFILVWTQQGKLPAWADWSTTVKLVTARLGFTTLMENPISYWWLPGTSTQKKSYCTTMGIAAKPLLVLIPGSNTRLPPHPLTYLTDNTVLKKIIWLSIVLKLLLFKSSVTCWFYKCLDMSFPWMIILRLYCFHDFII